MSADKSKLEFFDDIKSQLVLILAGIVSLATVIPAFLNSTAEMLGWDNIRYGYYLFVFLYFVTPYLFYLIYCSIHDDVGYLELLPSNLLQKLKKWKHYKTAFEIAIPLLALVYLVWPQCPLEEVASMVLYFSAVVCCIYFGAVYWKQGGVYTEFRIIACTIILAFAFFLGNMLKNNPKYSSEAQNKAFEAYETRNALKKDFINVLDSMRREAYKCRMQAAVQKPSLETTPLKGDGCTDCGISEVYDVVQQVDAEKDLAPASLKRDLRQLKCFTENVLNYDNKLVKDNNDKLYRTEEIYQACAYLCDYGLAVQRKQMTAVNGDWAKLLQNLQFKSMIWFQFLILLGLCLWLKMQIRLRSPGLISYNDIEEETLKKTDNISQVKSLILLLFVLTVPWLRHIDASDIELERPFLNVSLSGLMDGTTRPPTPVCTVCPEKARPDSTRTIGIPFFIHTVDTETKIDPIWYPYSIFGGGIIDSPYRYKRDPILDSIKRNIDTNQQYILELAKRTIGNPAERDLKHTLQQKKKNP
jgi:hypothetical protein